MMRFAHLAAGGVLVAAAAAFISGCRSTPGTVAQPQRQQSSGRVAEAKQPLSLAFEVPDNWLLDVTQITKDRGTGGLDVSGKTPAGVFLANVAPDGFVPASDIHYKGFYFAGPGKILPEAALRIDRHEQCVRTHDGTDENWSGPQDCSALAWMVRTEDGLRIWISVTDDVHQTVGEFVHLSDSVELYFDVRGERRGINAYEKGVFQVVLLPDKASGKVSVEDGAGQEPVDGLQAKCGFRDSCYDMEVFVPFSGLAKSHCVPQRQFHFDIGINDSDSPGRRDTQMMWAGTGVNSVDARAFGRMRCITRGSYYAAESEPADGPPKEALLHVDSIANIASGETGDWTGPDDCSAVASVRRSKDGLTVTVDVTDDNIQLAHERPWENDGIELYFDLRPDATRGQAKYDKGVFQVIVNPAQGNGPAHIHFGYESAQVPGLTVASKMKEKGYRLEVFIPFKGLKVNHMIPGPLFNFDVSIDDSDSPKGRDTIMCWSGFHLNYENASSFGRMSLLGKGP